MRNSYVINVKDFIKFLAHHNTKWLWSEPSPLCCRPEWRIYRWLLFRAINSWWSLRPVGMNFAAQRNKRQHSYVVRRWIRSSRPLSIKYELNRIICDNKIIFNEIYTSIEKPNSNLENQPQDKYKKCGNLVRLLNFYVIMLLFEVKWFHLGKLTVYSSMVNINITHIHSRMLKIW